MIDAEYFNKKLNGNYYDILDYVKHPFDVLKNIKLWNAAKVSDCKFVFVIGAPRSGTTLVQRLISNHSNIHSFNGETSVFSPKNIFRYERFAHIVDENVYDKVINSSDCIVTFFERLHFEGLCSNVKDEGYILEKTPQHIKKLDFLIKHFPNAKFVHVIRDPRDCYYSGKAAENIPQSQSAKRYNNYWLQCVNSRVGIKNTNIIDVFYERLTSSPEKELTKIMNHLDLPLEVGQLDSTKNSSDKRSNEKAFLRLNQKVSNKTVGQWKEKLSSKEINDLASSTNVFESVFDEY